jgi:hypothetical protein
MRFQISGANFVTMAPELDELIGIYDAQVLGVFKASPSPEPLVERREAGLPHQ